MSLRGCKHYAVRHRYPVQDRKPRSFYGAGYQLPAPFAAIVNGILSVFTKYRMDKEGTLMQGWSGPLFQINQDIPTGCGSVGQRDTNLSPNTPLELDRILSSCFGAWCRQQRAR
jgi:hypothetical protein